MVEIIITDQLHRGLKMEGRKFQLVTMRKISCREVVRAKKIGLRRYYLPNLTHEEKQKFIKEYGQFWDQVIEPFDSDHPFWRNTISSKMQEWEESATYLALILFTITQNSQKTAPCIVIVCSSPEEEEVCESWGKMHGWVVYRKPFLGLPLVLRKLYQVTKNIFLFFLRTGHFLYQKLLIPSQKIASNDSTVLIASVFYPDSLQNGNYRDPFFGQIHSYLSENGQKCDYLCTPIGKLNSNFRDKIKAMRETKIYIPFILLGWLELLALAMRVFFRRLEISESKFMDCEFTNLLKWNSHRFSNSFSLMGELYFTAVSKLCQIHSYKRLIVNFEGSNFERGCIQAFQKYGSGRITGYCQGVIYPLNLKLYLTLKEKTLKPEPDTYICTGPHSKFLLEKYGRRSPSAVFSGCSLKQFPMFSKTTAFLNQTNTVLVCLDGVNCSTIILDWLMENSIYLNEYHFLIRTHPNVPIRKLLSQSLVSWPANFTISNGSLEDDLQNTFCVLYRQTSVGLQALLNDLPAIHLNIDLPLPGDPMRGMEATWSVVKNYEELVEALKRIKTVTQKTPIQKLMKQKETVKTYLSLPRAENMKAFLN